MLRLYLYARVRFFAQFCTRDRGCSKHPAFPAPSVFFGRNFLHSLGASRRENVKLCAILSVVIVREGGRPSIPETSMIEPRSRGVLDPPHARGMTALVSLRGAK